MLIEHAGKRPTIDPTAWVAPDATVCGDVTIGPGVRILHGARVVGEAGGAIRIGRDAIIMENAVIRASSKHPYTIGDHCLIGPNAHVTGATLEDEVFVATGAAIFHGAALGRGSEVRVHATVHLRTRLAPGATVPIGWVAVGDPARILTTRPARRHLGGSETAELPGVGLWLRPEHARPHAPGHPPAVGGARSACRRHSHRWLRRWSLICERSVYGCAKPLSSVGGVRGKLPSLINSIWIGATWPRSSLYSRSRVPDAAQRHSASKTRVNALMAVRR